MIDLHAHILPGLDDGACDLDEAVEMARIAEEDGITKNVGTPHLFHQARSIYDDIQIIEEKWCELKKAIKKEGLSLEVFRGAEVFITHNLMDEIRKHRENLVLNNSSYMFIEFPSDHVFSGVKHLFFEMMSERITPIIAHPERNSVFVRNTGLLYELVQMGGLCQANSGSFSGFYGNTAQQGAYSFLKLNLIHFVASDCHNSRSMAPKLSGAAKILEELKGKETAQALLVDNPQAVLDDRPIPYHPEAVDPEEKEKSLKIKLPKIFRGR